MKIIGRTKNGFIIEAIDNEVYNLIGYYSKYDNAPHLDVGDNINVNKMFSQLYNLKNTEKYLATVSKELRSIADYLVIVQPVTKANNKEDESVKEL